MIEKLECTCIEAYKTRNMRDPNCCACSCDHNGLVEQLTKANERIAELESYNVRLANESHEYQQRCTELEKDLLRQSVFMINTAAKLENHREWKATASVLRRPTREARKAVNKFAIETRAKALQSLLNKKCPVSGYVIRDKESREIIAEELEQLRKEQE